MLVFDCIILCQDILKNKICLLNNLITYADPKCVTARGPGAIAFHPLPPGINLDKLTLLVS